MFIFNFTLFNYIRLVISNKLLQIYNFHYSEASLSSWEEGAVSRMRHVDVLLIPVI